LDLFSSLPFVGTTRLRVIPGAQELNVGNALSLPPHCFADGVNPWERVIAEASFLAEYAPEKNDKGNYEYTKGYEYPSGFSWEVSKWPYTYSVEG